MTLLFLSDFLPDGKLKLSDRFILLIQEADKVIFNLEGSPQIPNSDMNEPTQIMPFSVDEVIRFIEEYDKDKFIIAVANNHILDNGASGFDYLVKQFNEHQIKYFGTSDKPYIIESGVAVLNVVTGETVAEKSLGEQKLNYLFYDTKKINRQIKYIESQTDKLIFYPHWGRDMDTKVFNTFTKKIKFEKKWQTFGHHTHVISGVAKNSIYSLGNTYIPHPYYFDTYPATRYGLAVVLDSGSMGYDLYTTSICREEDRYILDATTFSGIPNVIKEHGEGFSFVKKFFLNIMAFRGNCTDWIKLKSLQALRSVFALKYKLSNKQLR